MAHIVGITGGIGCGKSVISRILKIRGYEVIDTDSFARKIMDSSDVIKSRIATQIHPDAVDDNGAISRPFLANIVFNDQSKLAILNNIVHAEVCSAIMSKAQGSNCILFVETAIFFQSRLNLISAAEIRVSADLELRISRVMRRNGLSRDDVLKRIASQQYVVEDGVYCPPVIEIVNNESTALLPQIDSALFQLKIILQ